jgi:uncharacterized RDD family membrane protein YckC
MAPEPAGSGALGHDAGAADGPEAAYAGLVTRGLAFVIDALIINLVALGATGALLLVNSVFAGGHSPRIVAGTIGLVLFAVWMAAYFSGFWATAGQTPGDRVMHIEVTRVDGSRLRPRNAVIRVVGMVISLPLFWGYLPILWSPRRRAFYDGLAGSVVRVVPAGKVDSGVS